MTDFHNNENQPVLPVEPTYGGAFSHGWEIMKKNFIEFLLIIFIVILISLPMGLIDHFVDHESFGYAFFTLFNVTYGLIIMGPISYGVNWVYLKAVRNESFKTYDIFMAFQNIWNAVFANILVSVIIGIGIVLLIIPGIIFACRMAFVSYLVMDQKLEAVEAVRKSWDMTRGYGWTIFGMGVMSIFIALAGIICLIVGIFPAIIWIGSAFASLYWAVDVKNQVIRA